MVFFFNVDLQNNTKLLFFLSPMSNGDAERILFFFTFSPKYQLHCSETKQISNKWIIAAPFHGVNNGETEGHRSNFIQWKDLENRGKHLDLGLSKMAQKTRVPAENPSLISSTHTGGIQTLVAPIPGNLIPLAFTGTYIHVYIFTHETLPPIKTKII